MLTVKNFKGMGRGLVATQDIKKGTVIEVSHVLVFSKFDYASDSDLLSRYFYAWKDEAALALGYGSLFNHSDTENVTWTCNYKKNTITYKTTKVVKKGEQLFLNYGYNPLES